MPSVYKSKLLHTILINIWAWMYHRIWLFVFDFVLSRIDFCNSLLVGSTHDVPSYLKQMQNSAASVIFCISKSAIITIHLESIHWLLAKVRSTFKIACLSYHCHCSSAPSYVTDMLQKKPISLPQHWFKTHILLLLSRPAHSEATLGDRSFSFDSSVCNFITNDFRCRPSLSSHKSRFRYICLFRSLLKD